jgi:hypothetical protein
VERAFLDQRGFSCSHRRGQTLRGKFQNGFNLVTFYAGEPFKKLIDRSAILKVLKKRPDWNTGASKQPSTAYTVAVAFYLRAGTPLFHKLKLTPEILIRKPCDRSSK